MTWSSPAPTVTALSPTHGADRGRHRGDDHRHQPDRRHRGQLRRQQRRPESTVVNATTVTATCSGGHRGSTVDVTVTTPGGTSSATSAGDQYTYDVVIPAPTVTGAEPDQRRRRGRHHGDDHRHQPDRRHRGQLRRQRADRSHRRQRDHGHGHRPGGHRREHGRRHGDHAGGHQLARPAPATTTHTTKARTRHQWRTPGPTRRSLPVRR